MNRYAYATYHRPQDWDLYTDGIKYYHINQIEHDGLANIDPIDGGTKMIQIKVNDIPHDWKFIANIGGRRVIDNENGNEHMTGYEITNGMINVQIEGVEFLLLEVPDFFARYRFKK